MPDNKTPASIDATEVTYADTVPEILRGEISLTKAETARGKELNAVPHLDRAKEGAEAWNLWVKWAEKAEGRWLEQTEINGKPHIGLKEHEGFAFESDFYTKNGIDFGEGLMNAEGRFALSVENFSGFIFPCPVSFKGAIFRESANFKGATFSEYANFGEAVFNRESDFESATFSREADFTGATFNGFTYFLGATFSEYAYFERATFSEYAYFEGATFREYAYFEGATFSKYSDFEGATFSETAVFAGATFSGYADFRGATFSGYASLRGTTFEKTLSSQRAVFVGKTCWDDTIFKNTVDFSESQFLGGFTAANTRFKGHVSFDHVWFGRDSATPEPEGFDGWDNETKQQYEATLITHKSNTVPDFKGTRFELPPNLGYTHIPAPPLPKRHERTRPGRRVRQGEVLCLYASKLRRKWPKLFARAHKHASELRRKAKYIADSDAAAKLRRLQELATAGHHHLAEKRFFRAELLSKRGHEATHWFEIFTINAFDAISGCGVKFGRAISWWAGMNVAFAGTYGVFAGLPAKFWSAGFEKLNHLFNYSFGNSIPVLGFTRTSNSAAATALFGTGPENDLPAHIYTLAGAHNLFSTILLFFVVLTIRNHFKLR